MKYKTAKIEDLSNEFKDIVKKANEEKKGIFVYGNTGTGKTHALYALANRKNKKVRNFLETLIECRDALKNGYYSEKLSDISREEFLFIDDIGSETTSDFVIELLYLLVNRRYEKELRTVFSTNLSLDEFKNRYGDRILSRIGEMCILFEMKGEDRRIS